MPATPTPVRLYVATDSFHYTRPDGADSYVSRGQIVGGNDPALTGRESLFEVYAPTPTDA